LEGGWIGRGRRCLRGRDGRGRKMEKIVRESREELEMRGRAQGRGRGREDVHEKDERRKRRRQR
jgi:hypothetical protein